MTLVCESERLVVRQLKLSDAEFIMRLLNTDSFIRYIGDRGVRCKLDAENYLSNRVISSYKQNGYGLNLVELKSSGLAIGTCGLLKREQLEYPDLGYAFLPEFCGKGYAKEAAAAVLSSAVTNFKLPVILAITKPDNLSSIRLLTNIGFVFKSQMALFGQPDNVYEYCAQEL